MRIDSQNYEVIFDVSGKEAKIRELDKRIALQDFWEDGDSAQSILKERTALLKTIEDWEGLASEFEEIRILLELAEEEDDEETILEVETRLKGFEKGLHHFEFQRMLGSEEDVENAIVDINAGAGGT
jgi:peptide chain release factor 2